ncbi:uncharacterized protein MYCFIDRAFT_132486 [Pseudocercospora fijiensis CIRAD86]|uniref:Carotenoid oxygenase n=1 Tax=Pseudocercospora fijiensis (strain CIRAD86) TaxID=383855 RepID=M3BCH7_PSEFD|nr:uncharacterized protein MYCFIDRAFT_132486 [Pseudocercospora fijiensis CIRAD86]EME86982.1 hypothetical protein MYCFIDRAFT_132486 [Pseudocercospora fijiensis CIRAD86]
MSTLGKRKRSPSTNIERTPQPKHPYLSGNFAPIQHTLPLTPCTYTGRIPEELADGEYVRNGSNPVSNSDLGRDAHWFDGDGMLSGVSFSKKEDTGEIQPEFVNQFILTDLYLSAKSNGRLRVPILPSIATLVNPLASLMFVTVRILRTILLVILSHLPGSRQKIKKISVANTSVVYHDGRAMAFCESGPPMRIQLPGLETVGWFNGAVAEGEPANESKEKEAVLGENSGLISFMREWTTAHPKVDPQTKEMLMFHSSFAPPYVQYSIIPQTVRAAAEVSPPTRKMLNAGVPGIKSAKMMHDFGVSSAHTIIMDLPLSLDPLNQLKGLPPVVYNPDRPSRFGVFPRRHPKQTKWFETSACCIFHTANTWDEVGLDGSTTSVSMLACRLTSATLIYAAGNMAPPPLLRVPSLEEHLLKDPFAEEQCRLYYYNFDLDSGSISHQWALSAVPFEFPSVRPDLEMSQARFVYGCSTTTTDFGSALGKATKIDALVKIDATKLIERGRAHPPKSVTGVVDGRTVSQVLISRDPRDPIKVFRMPEGWFAQEPRFVPRERSAHERQLNDEPLDEDDGYLLFYAFDETQLLANGEVPDDSAKDQRAKSELWIVNAKNMRDVIARVHLPQRVPYGLHGSWFSAEQISEQRPVDTIRSMEEVMKEKNDNGLWMKVRERIETLLG